MIEHFRVRFHQEIRVIIITIRHVFVCFLRIMIDEYLNKEETLRYIPFRNESAVVSIECDDVYSFPPTPFEAAIS